MSGLSLGGAEGLRAALADAPTRLRSNLRREYRSIAQPISDDMRRRANHSTRIPGAVKVRPRVGINAVGIVIYVDSRAAPHARALNNRGRAGTFRHPVFGNLRVWRDQTAMPFFEPAVAAGRGAATAASRRAFDETIRSL